MPTFRLVDGRPVVPIRLCWDPDEASAFVAMGHPAPARKRGFALVDTGADRSFVNLHQADGFLRRVHDQQRVQAIGGDIEAPAFYGYIEFEGNENHLGPVRGTLYGLEMAFLALLGMDFLAHHELHLVGRTFELVRRR